MSHLGRWGQILLLPCCQHAHVCCLTIFSRCLRKLPTHRSMQSAKKLSLRLVPQLDQKAICSMQVRSIVDSLCCRFQLSTTIIWPKSFISTMTTHTHNCNLLWLVVSTGLPRENRGFAMRSMRRGHLQAKLLIRVLASLSFLTETQMKFLRRFRRCCSQALCIITSFVKRSAHKSV